MRSSPVFLAAAAGLATLGLSQLHPPTAQAQAANAVPALRAAVQSLHTKQTLSGVELTGRIQNTGRQTLTYTALVCIFTDASNREVGRGDGYLLAGPVAPGQSAGFRAMLPQMPASSHLSLRLREAGQTVTLEAARPLPADIQALASRPTTVR